MLWEGLFLDIDPLRKERRIKKIRKWCKVLGHPSTVRPRNLNPTRVRWNTSTTRSRGTKKNYPQYITSLDPNRSRKKQVVAGQDNYMIIPCNLSICDSTTWVLDTRSPFNIYNSLQGLQVSKKFEEGERFLNVGDGRSILVLALGTVKLVFKSNIITLSECHFCPSFLLNIISVGLLTMYGYEILIKEIILISL